MSLLDIRWGHAIVPEFDSSHHPMCSSSSCLSCLFLLVWSSFECLSMVGQDFHQLSHQLGFVLEGFVGGQVECVLHPVLT